eukprot:666052-Pleurochrysis_carterae.AAC.1
MPEPDKPMRLAVGLYYDGVETVNPIWVALGGCAFPIAVALWVWVRSYINSNFASARHMRVLHF